MGLYDDDPPITSGYLGSDEYISTKSYYDRFEDALKLRQPEYVVKFALDQLENELPKAVKKYPEHEEVKKWKARAEQIGAKISKNPESAKATEQYEANWSQPASTLWRYFHMAKGAEADGQWSEAAKMASWYVSEFEKYTEPGSTNTLAVWYKPVADDWKKKHAEWYQEAKSLETAMKAKV